MQRRPSVPRRKAWAGDDPLAFDPPPLPCVVALKAVAQGTATEDQQRRFMTWLINDACGYGQNCAHFGEDAALRSYLAMGRQRVAQILKTLIETPIQKFKDGESSEQVM